MAAFKFMLCVSLLHGVLAKGSESQIECTPEVMKVTVPMDGDRQLSYLDQLKEYKPCKPAIENNVATFMLDLQDPHTCGVTRVLNKLTGKRTFYHKIVIETAGGRETHTVRCVAAGKRIARAVDFPLDLIEPDVINITRNEQGYGPDPILAAVVKQNGRQVTGEISVSPGTPLSMEINLDEKSKSVYGLLVNYMHVTDTGKQQETIIFNGCSVDPYLFDNFITTDDGMLSAKFRAFKFPDTSYVQFKGTVTVCLDKCQGVQCTNGVTGYGRRRRSIASGDNSNKVYEVSLTTFIKVDWKDGEKQAEDVLALLKNLKVANQRLEDNDATDSSPIVLYPEEIVAHSSASALRCSVLVALSLLLVMFK
ncbi:uncharacterized protein LOC134802778 [Cydia splendana]|uniref:uncharacterized protein LOC134802778 n=1 Tax=Cydia splendana TaxID=1100963 RepID=UPI00212FADE2